MSIQQLMLGVGAKKKTYIDDVFNNYLWRGNSTDNRAINVGFNYASEEGLVWIKNRQDTDPNCLFDTLRGANKRLSSNTTNAETTTSVELKSFTSTGYTLGTDGTVNGNTKPFVSWNFKSAPGFCDVVTYTGTGTSTNADGHLDVNHQLGSVPGMVIVKRTSGTSNWWVFHRGMDNNSKSLFLHSPTGNSTSTNYWNNTSPTATQFTVGEWLNGSGSTYVAYIFAGGESEAATARSVEFDGDSYYLSIADHADFDVGTNWTAECWFKADGFAGLGYNGIMGQWPGTSSGNGWVLEYVGTDLRFYLSDSSFKSLGAVPLGQWHHVAISKSGSTTRIFLNGTQVVADFDMGTVAKDGAFTIGGNIAGGGWFYGKISNVRIVKGTAVYTSSFRPPTEPLTNITNTVLLCCNNSSAAGSTVTPGTITNYNSTASTDSPFDDPAAFTFGDSKEGIIKCGSYFGNGSSTGPEINLGWEPQWWLVKRTDSSANWQLLDSMRGWPNGGNDAYLVPNDTSSEGSYAFGHPTSTGFVLDDSHAAQNADGGRYVYMAIRRPDGYVQKPQSATNVFAMDTGTGFSTIPSFDSGFPVDFALQKPVIGNGNTGAYARLIGHHVLYTPTTGAEQDESDGQSNFDSNLGYGASSDFQSSSIMAWMFKRHAGFTVCTWKGDGVAGRQIAHDMNKVPEMMWVKNRETNGKSWKVYHKGLNGGTNPEQYNLELSGNYAEGDSTIFWNDTAPTSTHFTVGTSDAVNEGSKKMLAILFASVDKISKCGFYTGSTSDLTIECGFQPRFVLIKSMTDAGYSWVILDSNRTWGSGNDNYLQLNSNAAQVSYEMGAPTSSGFTVAAGSAWVNGSTSRKYIYYAHA